MVSCYIEHLYVKVFCKVVSYIMYILRNNGLPSSYFFYLSSLSHEVAAFDNTRPLVNALMMVITKEMVIGREGKRLKVRKKEV